MSTTPAIKKIGWTESLIFLGFLLFTFMTPLIFNADDEQVWQKVMERGKSLLPFFLLALINHYLLLPQLLFKNKKVPYIFGGIVLIGATVFFSSLNPGLQPNRKPRSERMEGEHRPPDQIAPQSTPRDPNFRPPPPRKEPFLNPDPMVNLLLMSIFVIILDTGLRTTFRWVKTEQNNATLEKENVQNRLSMLKNQVSPHFFMNTLNNLHALIDVDQEQAKSAVIKLSKLMRHLLHEPTDGKILLSEEMIFLNNYIDLMRMRYNEKVEIKVDFPGEVPEIYLPPLLFVSLIENAFKHGISYNALSYIHIAMELHPDSLDFSIANSNHSKQEAENTGIGIKNTQDRLDLLYPSEYELKIEESEDAFQVNLTIPL